MIKSINPFTQEIIQEYSEDTVTSIAEKIDNAQQAFLYWKNTTFTERAQKLHLLSNRLIEKKEELAQLITQEMGKPITQSRAEIEKCAWVCAHYADIAAAHLQAKNIDTDAKKSYVRYEPLGVLLAIMPWNFPFWQFFRFAAPNIMAGNVILLKHASSVTGCALAIEKLVKEVDFGCAISQSLIVSGKNMSAIIAHQTVKAVTLTGSVQAGSEVASISGKLIKKTVLELGGNNALIVFDDADIDKAVATVINARYLNAGQSCIAGKRLFIQHGIYDIFLEKLIAKIKLIQIGNPLDSATEMSVMASEEFAKTLENQMQDALENGAKLAYGGNRNVAFFEPTILTHVTPEMPIFEEETFGPLLIVLPFKTEQEAIQLSNKSPFGLGVSIFTENELLIERIIPQLEEGAVFVNEMVKSDPRLPFGGIKMSGYGRELATEALFEFVNIKTVYIK